MTNSSAQVEFLVSSIVTGEVKKEIPNANGGWLLIWSPSGRFRADAKLFKTRPEIGTLVSFLPDEGDSQKRRLDRIKRVREILFQ